MAKERINVVVIGHLDSGKSTTIGHIIYQCGGVTKSDIDKYEEEGARAGKGSLKYVLAWVLDNSEAERQRGTTIDSSLCEIELSRHKISIIDVPGHRDYIENTIAGISQADCAVLVIDASEGIFEAGISEGGQTREHALLAYTLGVRQLIVAVNKLDLTNWSQARYLDVARLSSNLLRKIGFNLNTVPFVPISALLGDNLITVSSKTTWYRGTQLSGKTLLEAIDAFETPVRLVHRPLRIPFDDIEMVDGIGTVATGRIESGVVKIGMMVKLAPLEIACEVKAIEVYNTQVAEASAGDIASLTFQNGSTPGLCRGHVCSDAQTDPAKVAEFFIAQIVIFNIPDQIRAGYKPIIHCHTAHVACEFVELLEKIDRRTGRSSGLSPASIESEDACIVKIVPSEPICVESFNNYPPLGRFIVVDNGRTIAVGVIKSINEDYVS